MTDDRLALEQHGCLPRGGARERPRQAQLQPRMPPGAGRALDRRADLFGVVAELDRVDAGAVAVKHGVSQAHLAAVQILPAGFEVVDEHYEFAWEKLVGKAVDSSAISLMDYTETQPDRWIGLPRAKPDGKESQLLGFSIRPTLQGDFVLPSLVVRDLHNPARAGWTPSLRASVVPAQAQR